MYFPGTQFRLYSNFSRLHRYSSDRTLMESAGKRIFRVLGKEGHNVVFIECSHKRTGFEENLTNDRRQVGDSCRPPGGI
jgi:hypothetical protein